VTGGSILSDVLVVDGRRVATVEVAARRRARARGLLGRDGLDGALLLADTRSVHTVGMRFALDVARCDADLRVIDVVRLGPGRLTGLRRGVRHVLEAEAGRFAAWGLVPGSRLSVEHLSAGDGWDDRGGPRTDAA
jgi:uncharacterized membrane protein (UPF0127 family)